MCRFTYYLGQSIRISDLVTEPEHSLIRQSYAAQEREEPLNGDGFGLGWYVTGHAEPGLFRSITPAWGNRNLHSLARHLSSNCILAHVRAASEGLEVVETNCHPFVHQRYALMHNGEVGAFREVRRPLLRSLSDEAFHQIRGTTDSEHLFAVFMDELRKEETREGAPAMAAALGRAIQRVVGLVEEVGGGEPSFLNVLVTDGEAAVVSRFTSGDPAMAESLYLSRGSRWASGDQLSRTVEGPSWSRAVLVSSEPLTDDGHWESVPPNRLVLIHEDLEVEIQKTG